MPRFNKFDICLAWYMYASHYHGGQYSKLYTVFARLGRLNFNAGITGKVERYFVRELSVDEDKQFDAYENARAIYESLVKRKMYQ